MSSALATRRFGRALALPTAMDAAAWTLLGAIVLVSVGIRALWLNDPFWIDEGLSVGIGSFPLAQIPEVLLQDGSPPLYYALLHVWMELFGTSEAATHALSLVFAVLTIPAGLWAGWSLFGARVGWTLALLCAVNPWITTYAHETRMYALQMLLALLATAAFAHTFAHGRRRFLPLFAVLLATMLWNHNWSLFFGAACFASLALLARERPRERRRLVRDGLIAFGIAGLLYLPWLPSLVFQALNTGAPWGNSPSPASMVRGFRSVLGGEGAAVGLLLVAGAGIAGPLRRRRMSEEHHALAAIAVIAFGTVVAGWVFSQLSPAWAFRYLAPATTPLLIVAAYGLSRMRELGVAALVLVGVMWAFSGGGGNLETSERSVAHEVELRLDPGDLVISTHPERAPLMRYYLGPGLNYATTMGAMAEPRYLDWRGALDRLEAAKPKQTIAPLLDTLDVGRNVLLVRPVASSSKDWDAPWTSLVYKRSSQWSRILARDPRFIRRAVVPAKLDGETSGVRGVLYTKVAD